MSGVFTRVLATLDSLKFGAERKQTFKNLDLNDGMVEYCIANPYRHAAQLLSRAIPNKTERNRFSLKFSKSDANQKVTGSRKRPSTTVTKVSSADASEKKIKIDEPEIEEVTHTKPVISCSQDYKMKLAAYGPIHVKTLAAQHSLAMELQENGKLEESLTLYSRLLQNDRRVLGPHHPDTLNTRNNIASILADQGKLQEAYVMYGIVLKIQHLTLGPDHIDLLGTEAFIADVLYKQRKHSQALEILRKLLPKQRQTFGESHRNTLRTQFDISMALDAIGQSREALLLCQRISSTAVQVLGPDHEDTLGIQCGEANILLNLGNVNDAFRLLTTLRSKLEKKFDQNHPAIVTVKDSLIQVSVFRERYKRVQDWVNSQQFHLYTHKYQVEVAEPIVVDIEEED